MKAPGPESAIAKLRESERLLRTVVANAPIVLFAVDRRGEFTLSEGKGLGILGLEPGEVVGRSVFEVYRDEPKITDTVRRALEGEEVSTAVEVGGRVFETLCSPVFDENGEVVGLIRVAVDVTESKRAEEEKASLARQAGLRADVSTALAASGDLRSILQRCAEATVRHLDAAFARIWTLNEEGDVLELRASAGMYTHLDGPHGRVPVGSFKIGLIAQERRPHLTNDVANDPRISDKEWAKREGLVGFAGHPLIVEDRLVGVMAVFARDPLAEDTAEALASVADAIAQGILRKRTEEKLRTSEAELKALFAAMNDVVLLLDAEEGRCLKVVSANPRLLYEPAEEQLGKTLHEVFPAEQADTFLGWIRRALQTRQTVHAEYGLTIDGAQRWLSANISPMEESVLWVVRDITERKEIEEALKESEERFRALVQNSSDLITLYDADGTIRYVSPALERMLGYEPEERIGATSFALIHPDDVARAKELFAEALRRPGVPIPAEVRARHRDGSWRYVEAVGTNMLALPSVGAVVLNGRDVTQRKEAEARLREAENRYRTLVERIPAITYIQEPDEPSRTTYISPQYEEILGYPVEECLNDPEHWTRILHPDDRERVLAEDSRTNASGDTFSMEYRQFAKDGSVVWIRDEAAAVCDEEGRVRYWIGVQIDVTERKVLEKRLEYQAFHDSLTGLPNRALFMDRLDRSLSRTKRSAGKLAVLFLDVDNLKVVNDSLGHEAGDRLLIAAAGLLKACLRPADTLARLSGDEFAILLEDVADISRATRVAERVAEALWAPLTLKEREVFITASIGIALSGSARDSAAGPAQDEAETLLRQADLAMYRAKSRGKAHHEVFDPAMNASAFERLEMGDDLRQALERDEFKVCYQPKMRLDTTLQRRLRFSGGSAIVAASGVAKEPAIVGMEALVRWEHPERGLLSPKEFVPVAEESGLIVPIGRKVLEKACRQARAWQELYPDEAPLIMCVNISARQFQHPELARDVARVLQQTGLAPHRLQLEITESVLMEDAHSTLDTLRTLEDLGVQLAIDDFGTGYSSLSYLKRFPVGFLKIDRSFVEPLGEDPEDAVIVSGIISLAHTLGMQVVAEGVETPAQLAYLQGLGCDMAQGNYFSEPLPSGAASALLARYLRTRLQADG